MSLSKFLSYKNYKDYSLINVLATDLVTVKKDALRYSETSVFPYQSTWRNIPQT